jgi:hypothetical protein
VVENSDLSYLKDLKIEQETFKAVQEMKELWPHHKYLIQNKIVVSNIDMEKRYQELNT